MGWGFRPFDSYHPCQEKSLLTSADFLRSFDMTMEHFRDKIKM